MKLQKESKILIGMAIFIFVMFITMMSTAVYRINKQKKHWQSPVAQTIQEEIIIYEVVSETIREITAYNTGDINQCSGNPCVSANGENICLALELGYNRCAANFVPFGTRLQLIGQDWEMQCLVVDRMNSRYKNRVDIAMRLDEYQRAKNFGKQKLLVRIIK